MNNKPVVDIPKALKSFRYAIAGLFTLFRSENNARIHLIAAGIAITFAWYLGFSNTEWAILIVLIGLVWISEAFNTSLEKLADCVNPQFHPLIKASKDLAAGGVLIAALVAVIAGGFLFAPKILNLLGD